MRERLRSITNVRDLRWWLPVAVVVLPIAYHALRAAAGNWIAFSDDAYFTARSRDVLTSHHPLVGAWSSGSVDVDTQVNNLGPLQLDLLAPFTKLAPDGGTAIGVAVTNIAAVIVVAWLIKRTIGVRAILPAMVPLALLTWTMGSEMLITPRQHQYLILPYVCFLVACWAVAAGDRWATVAAVVSGSLLTQTHLSYPILVAGVGGAALVGHVVAIRVYGATGSRRPWIVALVVGLVLWSQTVVDQFFGRGNLTAALSSPGESDANGLVTGVRVVARVLVSTDALLRPGYRAIVFDDLPGVGGLLVLATGLIVAGAALVVLVRRGSWRWAAGVLVALVAVLAGFADAALLPRTIWGLLTIYYRWLWATAAFIAVLAAVAVGRLVERTGSRTTRLAAAGVAAVVLASAAIANVPRSVQSSDPEAYVADRDSVRRVVEALRSVDLPDPVVVDVDHLYFSQPYTYAVLVLLQERGIDFRLEGDVMARRFGEGRRSDGTEPHLVLWHDQDAQARRGSPDLVAYVDEGIRDIAITLEGGDPP